VLLHYEKRPEQLNEVGIIKAADRKSRMALMNLDFHAILSQSKAPICHLNP